MTMRACFFLLLAGCSSASTHVADLASTVDLAHAVDAATPPDLAAAPMIACLQQSCDPRAHQVCCAGPPGDSNEEICAPDTTTCSGYTLACDTPDDCPGQKCCGIRSTAYTGTRCADDCADPNDPTATICASADDCGGEVCGKGFWFGLDDCGM